MKRRPLKKTTRAARWYAAQARFAEKLATMVAGPPGVFNERLRRDAMKFGLRYFAEHRPMRRS